MVVGTMNEAANMGSAEGLDLRLRLYGANELGIRSVSVPQDEMPRTKHVAAELFVGVDHEGTAVTETQVDAWHARFPALLRAGVRNAPVGLERVEKAACVISDEQQAAAVLYDPKRSAAIVNPKFGGRFPLRGELVLAALARNCTVVVGSKDPEGIDRILDLAEECLDSGAQLVSIHPVIGQWGQWLPFDWEGEFPDRAPRIGELVRRFGLRAYEDQAPTLATANVTVAKPSLHHRDDGRAVTWAALNLGEETLLPVVDAVAVRVASDVVKTLPLPEFLERAGDAAVAAELSPARYRVSATLTRDSFVDTLQATEEKDA